MAFALNRARSAGTARIKLESAAMIEFDLNGRKLALDETVVHELRERALARAGLPSTLDDLAVILTRARSPSREAGNASTSRIASLGTST
jgi:hypothetical protein